MEISDKIYVAGHRGLVGSALVRRLRQDGYENLLLKTRADLDLSDASAVRRFFSENRPHYVFLAAAKVGGILANDTFPAAFIFENLKIQTNVIHESWRCGVERLLFLGSSCIYPRLAPQPLPEESLLAGPLEPTNRAYAVAKIAGIEMCRAYNRQYGTRFLAAMPTNLYGPGDNYDPHNSHLMPALIRKMHAAKVAGSQEVVLWGSGTPRREFLHNQDAADACIFLLNLQEQSFSEMMNRDDAGPLVNVGCGEDRTIRDLAKLVARTVGVTPRLVFDSAMPDGTPSKLLDISRLAGLGWKPRIGLEEGLRETYADFCSQFCEPRSNEPQSAGRGQSKPVPQCAS